MRIGGVDTHGRWPLASAALVIPAWGAALADRERLGRDGTWIAALGLPILVTHQTEEWVRPGGFLPFCNQRLLGSDDATWPLTERDGFHVNVTYGWSTAIVSALAWERTAAPAALVLVMEAGNALMHIGIAARERRYNPGLVTSVAMGAHAVAGAIALTRSGRLSKRGLRAALAAAAPFSPGLPIAMKLRMRAGR